MIEEVEVEVERGSCLIVAREKAKIGSMITIEAEVEVEREEERGEALV